MRVQVNEEREDSEVRIFFRVTPETTFGLEAAGGVYDAGDVFADTMNANTRHSIERGWIEVVR